MKRLTQSTDPDNLVFIYETDDCSEPLRCLLAYDAPERGSREPLTGLQLEPDYPATYTLHAVFAGLVDIYGLISDARITLIEECAFDFFEG
jgi:hypothetical protein